MGKGIAYVSPFNTTLSLRPIEVEFENNKCCMEIHNSSDSTVEFLFGNEIYVVRRCGRLAPRQPLSVCALLPA